MISIIGKKLVNLERLDLLYMSPKFGELVQKRLRKVSEFLSTRCIFAVFASKIQLLWKEVSYKVSLCENFQRQSCTYLPHSPGSCDVPTQAYLKFTVKVTHHPLIQTTPIFALDNTACSLPAWTLL